MTDTKGTTRRKFLQDTGLAAGGALAGLSMATVLATARQAKAQMDGGGEWNTLTVDEAAALAAVADQVLPPTTTPGAVELGAVSFMDAALGGFMAGPLPMVREGISDLDARARSAGGERFADLGFDVQTQILKAVETSSFFGLVHFLTLLGVFALAEHGGNAGEGGWELIGFESRHAWQPPFGYYDALAAGETDHARA